MFRFRSMAIHTVLGFVEEGGWGHQEVVVDYSTFVCEKGFIMRGV